MIWFYACNEPDPTGPWSNFQLQHLGSQAKSESFSWIHHAIFLRDMLPLVLNNNFPTHGKRKCCYWFLTSFTFLVIISSGEIPLDDPSLTHTWQSLDCCGISKTTFKFSELHMLTATKEPRQNNTRVLQEWCRRSVSEVGTWARVIVVSSDRKNNSGGFWNLPVELLSYHYLSKCRLHGSWLHCWGAKNPCEAREFPKERKDCMGSGILLEFSKLIL